MKVEKVKRLEDVFLFSSNLEEHQIYRYLLNVALGLSRKNTSLIHTIFYYFYTHESLRKASLEKLHLYFLSHFVCQGMLLYFRRAFSWYSRISGSVP